MYRSQPQSQIDDIIHSVQRCWNLREQIQLMKGAVSGSLFSGRALDERNVEAVDF